MSSKTPWHDEFRDAFDPSDESSGQASNKAPEEEADFGAILAAFEAGGGTSGADPKPGEKARGTVISIAPGFVFVDLGAKSEGAVAAEELLDEEGVLSVAVGDFIEGVITGRDEGGALRLSVRPGHGGDGLEALIQAKRHGLPVEGVVSAVIKGGVEVSIGAVRAFCPISQLDNRYVEQVEDYLGRRLEFRIETLEEGRGGRRPNVVLSRRKLLEEQQRAQREELLARLEPGMVVEGTVTSVTKYGAFLDLGGLEGLLHISEMSRGRVEDPASVATVGESLEVEVLSIQQPEAPEEGSRRSRGPRIALSRKSLERDPWKGVTERYPLGRVLEATMRRSAPFGAFLELEPGIDALLPLESLAALTGGSTPRHPDDVLRPGQRLSVLVERVDEGAQRIRLRPAEAHEIDPPAYDEHAPPTSRGGGGFGTLGAQLEALAQRRKKVGDSSDD
ncbi:MAG: S1 RNA-binding domain-containing protein [Acidobacteriota bacterium]